MNQDRITNHVQENRILTINKGKCRLLISNKITSNNSNDIKNKFINTNNDLIALIKKIKPDSTNLDTKHFLRSNVFLRKFQTIDDPLKIMFKIQKNTQIYEEFLKSNLTIDDIFSIFDLFHRLYSCNCDNHLLTILSKTLEFDFLKNVTETIKTTNVNYFFEKADETEDFFESIGSYLNIIVELITPSLQVDFKNMIASIDHCLERIILTAAQLGKNWTFIKEVQTKVHNRWRLYQYWVKELRRYYQRRANSFQREYEDDKVMFDELGNVKKAIKIERFGAQVIGATTTSAARCQHLLTLLKPKIVIIEEAAELLEAHAVVSLSKHCQHVILIGDHQQLRPSTASYRLETDFNLGVSLFERMIKNGLHAPMLTVQHRMRPEISALITPSIYSKLDNHATVCNLPDVMGIVKNVYFIDHNNFENEMDVSKMNIHECDLLLNLCKYLLQQGYDASEITILATYLAQKTYMLSARERLGLPTEITITSVDNFQGEENRIILLSLVRCNEDNKVGFLSVENRICVALSRAKEGLYVAGNMPSLIANSKVWAQINQVLIKNENIGKSLPLICKAHKKITNIITADELEYVLENGCGQKCNLEIYCGHICPKMCHSYDIDHKNKFRCMMECEKCCENGHPCLAFCGDICPPCQEPIDYKLNCNHMIKALCYQTTAWKLEKETIDPVDECTKELQKLALLDYTEGDSTGGESENFDLPKCNEPCGIKLKCGHTCKKKCHVNEDPLHDNYVCHEICGLKNITCPLKHKCKKECYQQCGECVHPCKKLLSCGHSVKRECHISVKDIEQNYKCLEICNKKLRCGHCCIDLCSEPCGLCKEMVEQVMNGCGHKILVKCGAPLSACNHSCDKLLQCGHKCKGKCSNQCDNGICKESVFITSKACGHKCEIPCHMARQEGKILWQDLFSCYCKELCKATLGCGHRCTGTCGECVQGRLHKKCTKKCSLKLLCGHNCAANCTDEAHLCKQKCRFKCRHGKCMARCSDPCMAKCGVKCARKCSHFRCKRKCWEQCDTKCLKDCPLLLPCGHPCQGYCGYKCPPVCTQCDKLSSTDEKDTRLVVLEECGHVTKNMEWLYFHDVGVGFCSVCRSPIVKSLFYKEKIDRVFRNLSNITTVLTKTQDLSEIKYKLNSKLRTLKEERSGFSELDDIYKFVINTAFPIIVGATRQCTITRLRSLFFGVSYILILTDHLKDIDIIALPKKERQILNARVNLITAKLKERIISLSTEQMLQFRIELIKLIAILNTYKTIINKIVNNEKLNFYQAKIDLKYNEDFADTIYSTKSITKTKVHSLDEMKATIAGNERKKYNLDLPEEFWDRTMHVNDWKYCENRHVYYRKFMVNCPNCSIENTRSSLYIVSE
ncbi:uncharacterized protein isoform X2 [Rhodnius prolixus]|uniref:uncharacterized protein isoform X2 n=1 Tax=Rhodnius prolixus TaxID=13249 RepID=UPI003D1899D2